jgi:hypothetical protein
MKASEAAIRAKNARERKLMEESPEVIKKITEAADNGENSIKLIIKLSDGATKALKGMEYTVLYYPMTNTTEIIWM